MKEEVKIVELITGNVTEEQKNDILNQVKDDAQLRKEFSSVKNAWALSDSSTGMSELRIEKAYLSLKAKIGKQRQTMYKRLYSFLKYAAVILIVFGAGVFSDKYFVYKKIASRDLTEFFAPSGQIAEVNLPDGSHVWLNSETQLSFSNNFTSNIREITLKGEAYFEVQKDKRPFVVSTKFGEIIVLGTSFNVSAFENSGFQATLVEGKIRYKNSEQGKEVILTPGQQILVSKEDSIQIHNVKPSRYTSWKDGIIVFEKEPLCIVMQKLERHFAVKIDLEDNSLGKIRFTGSVENEDLLEVMEYINKTEPIQYSFNKKLKLLTVSKNSSVRKHYE